MTATFDPVAYKDTTRAQWEEAAAAWHAWGPTLETWLAQATSLMLDAAGIHTGSAVLDVAAGAGGHSLAAASRAGPSGTVLATYISPPLASTRRYGPVAALPPSSSPRPTATASSPSRSPSPAAAPRFPRPPPANPAHSASATPLREIQAELSQFEGPEGFTGPRELIVCWGGK